MGFLSIILEHNNNVFRMYSLEYAHKEYWPDFKLKSINLTQKLLGLVKVCVFFFYCSSENSEKHLHL